MANSAVVDHELSSANGTKGLKGGSLGLVAVIVIGVASTAPGKGLAASIGFVTGEVAEKAPFIMLFVFVPMGCIAAAFHYLTKADPDCGTNFTWGVRVGDDGQGPLRGALLGNVTSEIVHRPPSPFWSFPTTRTTT
jgi:hypothetical protein